MYQDPFTHLESEAICIDLFARHWEKEEVVSSWGSQQTTLADLDASCAYHGCGLEEQLIYLSLSVMSIEEENLKS